MTKKYDILINSGSDKMSKKNNDKEFNKLNILNVFNLITTSLFLGLLVKLNMIPKNYMMIITSVIILIDIIGIVFTNVKSKIVKVIGTIIVIPIIIISLVASYFVYTGNSFLDKSFNNVKNEQLITYYVVTYKDNVSSNRNDIDSTVYYPSNDSNIKSAISTLKKYTKNDIVETNDIVSAFNMLANKEINFILLNNTTYEILFDNNSSLSKDNYKIIYTYKIKIKNKIENKVSSDGDSFNIYVSGTDFANLNDFNMIVTINMKTHKILLTSIPRDYYIPVYGTNGIKDNLSFIGVNDINTRIKSLEEFFGISFDYYLKINTNSLVGIVDAIGGIEYCSDVSFTTTHATILDSYDDSRGSKLTIKEGCQHLNGIQTLTVARERNAFNGRDRQRQKNCQAIIVDIFEKLISVNTITNYNNILNSLSNLYETTLPREIIEKIMKDTINGAEWKFENQSVDGSDTQDYIHLNSMKGWVMYPMEETVKSAKEKINEIMKK